MRGPSASEMRCAGAAGHRLPAVRRGRYAPSPTGAIHVGNARTALVAWLSIRRAGGCFVWRVEDLDALRVVPGLAAEQQRDLVWLGLDWDEGPERGGDFGPYQQSLRSARYVAALRRLEPRGLLFPCTRSRRELQEIASAPHGPEASPYPPSLRPRRVEPGWLEAVLAGRDDGSAVRLRVDPVEVAWEDLAVGPRRERVDREVGDFVLRRRDGLWAYQLAVVVDDLDMAIDEVVRGADLIDSTGRQILLFEALGGPVPRFGHAPLMVSESGEKLSKRHASLTLAALREAGVAPERLVGYLAHTLGLRDRVEPTTPRELVSDFRWEALLPGDTPVPEDLAVRLLRGDAELPRPPREGAADAASRAR
ncbi:MAG TPA: tRNA glutamyl-Q(34) synthetase GluQRS [Thermoanaerobaculia bacterium]|nr:tRNA glutamyl-Q(34) synthetase GluQRS [Thermoanaerobaculia bacterium]